jgi:hypothetical protein
MCEWSIQAQRTYTNARVVACQTIDLRKLKGLAFPVSISSDLGDSDDSPTDTTSDGPMPPSTEDGKMTENCPILGKYSCCCSYVVCPEVRSTLTKPQGSSLVLHLLSWIVYVKMSQQQCSQWTLPGKRSMSSIISRAQHSS